MTSQGFGFKLANKAVSIRGVQLKKTTLLRVKVSSFTLAVCLSTQHFTPILDSVNTLAEHKSKVGGN